MDLKREGSRKGRGRKVRLLSRKYLPGSKHVESNAPFLLLASEYGSTSRKDAMTPVSYERCDRRSEFRVREIPLTREWTTCELVRVKF